MSKKEILIYKTTHNELMKCKINKKETNNQLVIRLINEYGGFLK